MQHSRLLELKSRYFDKFWELNFRAKMNRFYKSRKKRQFRFLRQNTGTRKKLGEYHKYLRFLLFVRPQRSVPCSWFCPTFSDVFSFQTQAWNTLKICKLQLRKFAELTRRHLQSPPYPSRLLQIAIATRLTLWFIVSRTIMVNGNTLVWYLINRLRLHKLTKFYPLTRRTCWTSRALTSLDPTPAYTLSTPIGLKSPQKLILFHYWTVKSPGLRKKKCLFP